ncbi:MAG: LysR family transcriptional regulator [Eubacterium sp.]|nr:LysR family transcriptional regulator [Eubacterium sp.]
MNWQHLVYFKVVAETENFSRASEQLYVTPSALSKAISGLEQELNFPLFEKSGRNSVLTDCGREFKVYVDQAIDTINHGLSTIHENLDICIGKVNIAGIYTMVAEYLPPRIKGFLDIYPKVNFSLVYQITLTVLDSIISGTADLGFCGSFDQKSKIYNNIESVLLKTEELVIVTSKDHPLSSRDYIDFSELKDENFITYRNVNAGIHQIYQDLCDTTGVYPRIAFEAPDDHTILGLVAANLGVALIANNPVLMSKDLHVLHFEEGKVPTRQQYMVWKKGHHLSPAVKAFRDYILDEIPDSV